jgi:hypothetical protein
MSNYTQNEVEDTFNTLLSSSPTVLAAGSCSNAKPYDFCGETHCNSQPVYDTMYQTCLENGWGKDVKVVTRREDGTCCYCWCSCVAHGTLVMMAGEKNKPIELIELGDRVLVVGSESEKRRWIPREVTHSKGSPAEMPDGSGPPNNETIYRVQFQGKVLLVNASHLFWTINKKTKEQALVRADRLYRDIYYLTSPEFEPVEIEEDVWYGPYKGGLWGIATSKSDTSIDAHLINTEGVVSGDFYLQTVYTETVPGVSTRLLELPQIGSPEYFAKYSNAGLASNYEKLSPSDERFTPARRFEAQAGDRSFMPTWSETPLPKMLRPLDDTVTLQKAQQIEALFKGFYPEINFVLNWNDNTANAYARLDSGKRYVFMLGGLIRHKHIGWQGLALVYAHEVGHHYAGEPRYPSPNDWGSCEGQADYWASLVSMRKVYPGEEYLDVMFPAIDQLYNFFSKGLLITLSLEEQNRYFALGCTHPPADCRKETFEAGVEFKKKPDCAA